MEKKKLKVLAALILPLVAAGLVYALFALKPKTKKRRPPPVVPIVEAVAVSPGSQTIHIEAFGTAVAAKEAIIVPEVEGKIVEINPELVPGGIVKAGELLARIDPSDYQQQVQTQKAALAVAESKLDIEKGQQAIARREWQIFEKENAQAGGDKGLALREPHLRSAMAEVEAAKSRLASAELALSKTELKAPFNAVVIDEAAEKGQLAGRQTKIATLAGTDYFWVQASVLPAHIQRIAFPSGRGKGAPVRVVLERPGEGDLVRTGRVEKLLGDLDAKGRMARLLIRIDDPLTLSGKKEEGKVLLGSYLRLEIEAGTLDGVYALPREAVRDGDRLYILKPDGTLDIRDAEVRWRRRDDILLATRIAEGERLIVSRIQNAIAGMKLRTGDRPEKTQEMKDASKSGEEGKEKR